MQGSIDGKVSMKRMFRLRSLTLLGHPILGNLSINFCQYYGEPIGIHTSVIIGADEEVIEMIRTISTYK